MSINRVSISGNLTRDPELRTTTSGTPVMSFTVAVNDRRRNAQTGEWEDYPNFVGCTMFGARAQAIHHYLTKGAKVCIEGRLHYSVWQAQDGTNRSKLDVTVDELEFMSRRPAAQAAPAPAQQAPAPQAAPAPVAQPVSAAPVQQAAPAPAQQAPAPQAAPAPVQAQAAPAPVAPAPVAPAQPAPVQPAPVQAAPIPQAAPAAPDYYGYQQVPAAAYGYVEEPAAY